MSKKILAIKLLTTFPTLHYLVSVMQDCVLWEVGTEILCKNFVSFILQISLKIKIMILLDVTLISLISIYRRFQKNLLHILPSRCGRYVPLTVCKTFRPHVVTSQKNVQ